MMRYEFLSLKTTTAPYRDALKRAACEVIESGWFVNGEKVKAFEEALANLCKCRYAVGVSNGLDALRLILRAYNELGVMTDGDEVIVPANTYIATVLAITDSGLKPVLVEPDVRTMNLDTALIERHITPRTKAVMTVHLYGLPCYDATLERVAREHSLLVIEDNAQAIGACTPFGMTGGLGNAAGNSFYPTKNLGAVGDAGAVTTNDEALAKVVRELANYGCDRRYHNLRQGLNCRLDEIQAAMLLVAMQHLESINKHRQQLASIYDNEIVNPLIIKPLFNEGATYHQYALRVESRDAFRQYLADNGVGSDVLYPTPIHRQPCYAEQLGKHSYPLTEKICNTVVSIPCASHISITDAHAIAAIINRYKQ